LRLSCLLCESRSDPKRDGESPTPLSRRDGREIPRAQEVFACSFLMIRAARSSAPDLGILGQYDKPGATEDLGKRLVNSGAFDWALEDIPDAGIKRVEDKHAVRMAMLLYNQLRLGARPDQSRALGIESVAYEDVQTSDLALPTKWALPIIRRIYPAIFDAPFFATQPMPGPLAYAFFMDFTREADSTDFRARPPSSCRWPPVARQALRR
jgi:hypothetical protein